MLSEIVIHDFAIIERLHVRLEEGLNVLTGETGSGKSIVIDALAFVLGARGAASLVRAGARAARVEATFCDVSDELVALLETFGVEIEARTVVLSREASTSGRNVYRMNGHMVTQPALKAAGELLVEIHGQHDAHALLSAPRHLDLLDRLGGAALLEQRATVAALWKAWKALRDEREALLSEARERERRREWLTFEAEEIEALALREEPDEREALEVERGVLANADKIRLRAEEARALLDGDDGDGGARTALGRISRVLSQIEPLDRNAAPVAAAAVALAEAADELAREIAVYAEGVESDPGRLEQVNERLDAIHRLQRKYGTTIRDIVAYGRRARAELAAIEHSQVRSAEIEDAIEQAGGRLAAAAAVLSSMRRQTAATLEGDVARELAALEMPNTRFAVRFEHTTQADGLQVEGCGHGPVHVGASGADGVELLISANPGQPLAPLARIASGGEMSRIMLAIQSVLARINPVPTMVFDEVDAGLGGIAAEAVAVRLRAIAESARGRQVVCITHLPLVAAAASVHWNLTKRVHEGRTVAAAQRLDASERAAEIARMMAGKQASETTLAQAHEMLARPAAMRADSRERGTTRGCVEAVRSRKGAPRSGI